MFTIIDKIAENYRTNKEIDNFINRTQLLLNKAKNTIDGYAIDELKPNDLYHYKITTIRNNPFIKDYLTKLEEKGIQVKFSQFGTATNKIIICNKNVLEIVEYLL